jgi:signal transduction histidine kinase/DNA-binding NarL/FixJ family response regulator
MADQLLNGLLHTPTGIVTGWAAVASAAIAIDAFLTRRHLRQERDRGLTFINVVSRTSAAAAFALLCFILLLDRTSFGLAAAMLVGCAITLNNAVITRGSWRFLNLVGPSAGTLVVLPFAAYKLGHLVSIADVAMLSIGAVAYTVAIVLLAAALHREREALRSALEAAQAASRAKSSFLAIASHEIRTPLNGVLGMAQALENDALSPEQRERVAVIRQSGQALLEVLNDVLDVSKIEAGGLELECAPFDLEALARSAHAAFSDTAARKGLAFDLSVEDSARGFFAGDAARVRQVLANLVSNAMKFTEAGTVAVAVGGDVHGVRLSVCDTGVGIAPARAEQIFEKFVQADASTTRRFGGTGLGLAICKELCAAMGGTIAVESEPGRGSLFVVELPLARCAAPPPAEATPAPMCDEDAFGAMRVLAAEDNDVNQLVLRTLLDHIGVKAVIVESGAEAVSAWEVAEYDLILMDVQMPMMDGPTAARTIRAREAATGRRRTPIVALTANAMTDQVASYTAAGMDGFVAKPIAIAALYAEIAKFGAAGASADIGWRSRALSTSPSPAAKAAVARVR